MGLDRKEMAEAVLGEMGDRPAVQIVTVVGLQGTAEEQALELRFRMPLQAYRRRRHLQQEIIAHCQQRYHHQIRPRMLSPLLVPNNLKPP